MITDPIGDMLVRIRNAGAVKKSVVSLPYSILKAAIAEKLSAVGLVGGVEKKGKKIRKQLDIAIKYTPAGSPRIQGTRRISKPGRRIYRGMRDLHPVRYGHGFAILSTPQGIMTNIEAKRAKVGGEVLFEIW